MENVQNRKRIEYIEIFEYEKIVKQQSNLTFNEIHKSYQNLDGFSFNQIEV